MRAMQNTAACAVAMLMLTTGVRADEVALDKLPKAITEALKAKFPKAEVKEAEKATEGKKTTYEVRLKEGELTIDVNLKEDGTIKDYEKQLAVKDLPKVVADALAEKFPKGKVTNAEAMYTVTDGKDKLNCYEIMVEIDGKTIEVEILETGKLKADEKKEEKKDK
jgi:Putative beta-lactamase-inhibitor-like, PepSY-like